MKNIFRIKIKTSHDSIKLFSSPAMLQPFLRGSKKRSLNAASHSYAKIERKKRNRRKRGEVSISERFKETKRRNEKEKIAECSSRLVEMNSAWLNERGQHGDEF